MSPELAGEFFTTSTTWEAPSIYITTEIRKNTYIFKVLRIKWGLSGTSLVVQWLRLQARKEGGSGSMPSQGTRSHVLQGRWKTPHATTKGLFSHAPLKTPHAETKRLHVLQLRPSVATKIKKKFLNNNNIIFSKWSLPSFLPSFFLPSLSQLWRNRLGAPPPLFPSTPTSLTFLSSWKGFQLHFK